MRKSFDIIDEKWLPVIMTDGTEAVVSTREAFEKAAEIKRLNVKSDLWMDEYCAYCFLYVMTIRAFGLKSERKILALHKAGKFDMDQFDDYIADCRKTISFDLFDEEKPFMQKRPADSKKKAAEIGVMMPPTYPSGNNAIMFCKHGDDVVSRSQTPAEFFIALLRHHRISGIGGAGYSASPFASAGVPLTAVPQGRNLFESLLMGIPARTENLDEEKPFWERGKYEAEKYGFGSEWVSNCFIPVHYIRYGKVDEDGTVRSVYYSAVPYVGKKGMYEARYVPKKNGKGVTEIKWSKDVMIMHAHNEPHIFYKGVTEEGKVEMTQCSESAISYLKLITDIVTAESAKYKYALSENPVIKKLEAGNETVEYEVYGLRYSQAKAEQQVRIPVKVPAQITDSASAEEREENLSKLSELLSAIGKIRGRLSGAICYSYGESGIPADRRSKPMTGCQEKSLKELGEYINDVYEDILNTLVNSDGEDAKNEWFRLWYGRIIGKALDIYKATPVHRGDKYAHEHAIPQYFNSNIEMKKGDNWEKTRKTLWDMYSAIRNLPKDYQYRLRSETAMDLDHASAMAKVVYYSSVPEEAQKLRGAFRYAVLFATQILSEGGNGNVKFPEFLKEISKESTSSNKAVLRLLGARDILNRSDWEQAFRLIKRASHGSKRRHLDLVELFTDMELWKTSHTADRWIAVIAPKTNTAKSNEEEK